TTHGAQIAPYLYAGAGAGTWFLYSKDGVGFLLTGFLDVRATLPTHRRFKPFIDVKVGFAGSYNTFVTPSIGYKYAWGKKGGVYLSLGSDLIFNEYNTAWDGLNVRLGFDF
ncbi:MAG: hypothetical protein K2M76_00090, partial [Muribaculaceae bacterium]|nr:hypothetical protein [Muribaculaceae bacterium]